VVVDEPDVARMKRMKSTPIALSQDADLETLNHLNGRYINAVQKGDIECFKDILADNFYCSNPDGTLVDRAAFLAQTAKPVTISELRADDVIIRIFGDTAIIHARTSYLLIDGREWSGRYTDVWVRFEGKWRAVCAHVTR
jgi:ketosteroid isomerase-like protein